MHSPDSMHASLPLCSALPRLPTLLQMTLLPSRLPSRLPLMLLLLSTRWEAPAVLPAKTPEQMMASGVSCCCTVQRLPYVPHNSTQGAFTTGSWQLNPLLQGSDSGFLNGGKEGVALLMPAGTYRLTQTLDILQSNVVLRGESVSASLRVGICVGMHGHVRHALPRTAWCHECLRASQPQAGTGSTSAAAPACVVPLTVPLVVPLPGGQDGAVLSQVAGGNLWQATELGHRRHLPDVRNPACACACACMPAPCPALPCSASPPLPARLSYGAGHCCSLLLTPAHFRLICLSYTCAALMATTPTAATTSSSCRQSPSPRGVGTAGCRWASAGVLPQRVHVLACSASEGSSTSQLASWWSLCAAAGGDHSRN